MLYTPLELQAFAASVYGGRDVLLTPYVYTLDFTNLTQNAPQTNQLQLTANSDFIATGFYAVGRQSDGSGVQGFGSILITDTSSGERFTDSAVPLQCYAFDTDPAGDTPSLHYLPYPRFIQGRGSLSVTINSSAPVTIATYQLQMHGVLCRARG